MEFGLLGEITVESGRVDVGHVRQRHVLAALLVDANRVVPLDGLTERVWGETLPPPSRSTLYSYLSRLRQALSEVDGVEIIRRPGGYLLTVDPARVDLHLFRRLVSQARTAADGQAPALLDRALGLWRGEPFAGVETPWFDNLRATLLAERDAATLDRTDLLLRCGEHAALLPGLAEQVAARPLDERLAGQYMLALHLGGRTTESLAHYDRISATLLAEAGAEPGPDLRKLRRRILSGDQTLTVWAAGSSRGVGAGPIPRQLPALPRTFVGRAAELARLTAELDAADTHRTLVISAIGGMGGVGKTWLALHWAHRHLDRFPDGQLFVNLRGFDPVNPPTPPAVAVRGFLEALGVAPESLPHEPESQVKLYRSLVAEKRMLVVLDNAADLAQVEPLLPGGARCTVIVTSRSQLVGLVAGHGAASVPLGTLSDAEATELLIRHLGRERTDAEPEAVAELVRYCAGQPLALGVLAARIVVSPLLPLAGFAAELRDVTGRLDALETGELGGSVRAVLTTSDRALSRRAAEVFRLVGLAGCPDIGLEAVASLAGLPVGPVRQVMRELVSAHIVVEYQPNRYRLHDLVRLYAAERGRAELPAEQRHAALRRLVDFHLHTADTADRILAPVRPRIPLDPPAPGCVPLAPADEAAALAWFDAERVGLLAACETARDNGWDDRTWQLAWAMNSFHLQRGHRHDSLSSSLLGLDAVRRLGDPRGVVIAHRQLGHAHDRLGQHTLAAAQLEQALDRVEQLGDLVETAYTHRVLALAAERWGDDQRALGHATEAQRLFEAAGDTVRAQRMLNSVGWLLARLGRYAEARTLCEQALAADRGEDGDPRGVAVTLDSLGFIAQRLGEHTVALEHYSEALGLIRELGMNYIEAEITERIAETHAAAGDSRLAVDAWRRAAVLYQQQGVTRGVERVQARLAEVAGRG
ncbi:AfsR/SARP family transcriptional regulator [Plantactinospora sonchi]|uniref:BTAD domain-containing putative transcriptional regulator n=1 Tax=Plantactinospora sonchi TaxID=1544735 RepID=A0ABU7S158_9ACTN